LNHKELRAQLNKLNGQLVDARRRGDNDTVLHLKRQLEAFIRQVSSSPTAIRPTLKDSLTDTQHFPVAAETSQARTTATTSPDYQAWMTQLSTLNEDLVHARRRGDKATVTRLKKQLQNFMVQVSSPNQRQASSEHQEPPKADRSPALPVYIRSSRPPAGSTEQIDAPSPSHQLRARLRDVNRQIISARRHGDHDEVQRLKLAIFKLIEDG